VSSISINDLRSPHDARGFAQLKDKQNLSHSKLILDGRGIDFENFTDCLPDLTVDDVVEGAKVSVEYILIPYIERKPNKKDSGFTPGCTLKLVSITLLEGPDKLDISIPSKPGRIA
jgi:hypothetical protein